MAPPDDSSTLLRLYSEALAQYRFEVGLNWDRMKHSVLFNVGLLSVATGLLAFPGERVLRVPVVAVLVVGAILCRHAVQMIVVGRRYTRVTMLKSLVLAHDLKLTELREGRSHALLGYAVATTSGMRDPQEALLAPRAWIDKPLGPGNVIHSVTRLLHVLAVAGLAAAAVVAFSIFDCPGLAGGC